MDKFWKLVEKSTITSGTLAIMLGGTVCYCAITQIPCPVYVTTAFGMVIGFFFASKAKDAIQRVQ